MASTPNNWELRKRGYLIRFGHTEALLFKKKRTLNGHFSRPAETDPYVRYWTALSNLKWLWMCIIRFLSLPKTTRCLKTDRPDSRRTRCLCEQVYLGHRHKQLGQEAVAAMILILGLCFLSKSDTRYFVKSKIFIWTSPTWVVGKWKALMDEVKGDLRIEVIGVMVVLVEVSLKEVRGRRDSNWRFQLFENIFLLAILFVNLSFTICVLRTHPFHWFLNIKKMFVCRTKKARSKVD